MNPAIHSTLHSVLNTKPESAMLASGLRGPSPVQQTLSSEESAARNAASPFSLLNETAYRRWRESKLDSYPRRIEDLLEPVRDLNNLTAEEKTGILTCIQRANMAVYAGPIESKVEAADESFALAHILGLSAQFDLGAVDANWLAGEDGVSRIEVAQGKDEFEARRGEFIPYTDRPIRWHTDGYYHPQGRRIRSLLLHCARPAASGGENALLDHEMAYIALRDENPDYIRALMAEDALTIPPRLEAKGAARIQQSGPVFSIEADGGLAMRYTARTVSIDWRQDAATSVAVAALTRILATSAWVLKLKLQAGMGILCNNVLHDRSGFVDDASAPRLIFRARFLQPIAAAPQSVATLQRFDL